MGSEPALTGPDLTRGVCIADVPSKGVLTGHADGEAVLLAREGDEFFAIGGTCTHYGGPLGKGLRVGESVRCPWHHACFSLRTGEALRAPAMNPVARYRVEQNGDRLYVREKITPSVVTSESKGLDRTVVIIGAGAAGLATAEALRREGFGGRIVLIGAEDSPPVDRPNLSKDYLAGTAPEEWIPLHPPHFYEDLKIELRIGTRVESIDPDEKRVLVAKRDEGSETLSYDTLVLATGAEPIRLAVPGADRSHVHYLRTLSDSRSIIRHAGRSNRAVVIGSSFIGLEVAASLRARELEVTVVAPEAVPLERSMGRELGEFIRELHERNGVTFRLGQTVTSIDDQTVLLSDGETLEADIVVIGIGVRPNTILAERAGLELNDGVVVNEYLETTVPGILAVGDIARWPDRRSGKPIRVEHWVVAQRHGQIAARNILGKREPIELVPFFWSAHYDVVISYVGHGSEWDEIQIDGSLSDHRATVSFRSGGKVLAVATIFRDLQSLRAELALERGDESELEAVLREVEATQLES